MRRLTTTVNIIDSRDVMSIVAGRKAKLMEYLSDGITNSELTTKEHQQVLSFLESYHDVFSLDEEDRGETGETDLIEMTIETGDADPKKQAQCRVPFSVRHEVAVQLRTMLEKCVIQPSNSLWASPIVLV